MRSDDKQVIHPDNAPLKASGELDLPDDLVELAAQLGDDAKHLAATYPANCGHLAPRDECACASGKSIGGNAIPHAEREGHTRRLRRYLAAAAILSVVAASATLWWPRSKPTRDVVENIPTRSVSEVPSPSAESIVRDTDAVSAPLPAGASRITSTSNIVRLPEHNTTTPATASPTMFLHEYSGPELEGLYDLIGEEEEESKVSI